VIRAGELVVENGEIRANSTGKLLHVEPQFDPAAVDHIRDWFESFYTIQFSNYPVGDEYLHQHEVIATRPR